MQYKQNDNASVGGSEAVYNQNLNGNQQIMNLLVG
jgi:hypothetical protein